MPRLPVTAIACFALASGAAIAGCGSDGDDDTASTRTQTPAAPQENKAGSGKVVEVSMKDIKFVPESVMARVGQKINWTNAEDAPHNVTATEGADFASDTLKKGDSYDYTPAKAGKIAYVCTIHTGQNGSITVTK